MENKIRTWMRLVESAAGITLFHGTSEAVATIRQHGLRPHGHGVFLTDNPELALDYADSDQARTGLDNITLVSVSADQLDPALLRGDIDHTLADDWQESLRETDQCLYQGPIPAHLLTIEDYNS